MNVRRRTIYPRAATERNVRYFRCFQFTILLYQARNRYETEYYQFNVDIITAKYFNFVNVSGRGILAWYRMMPNIDFLFDGPQSRENKSYINESEQLVLNPPEELQNSTPHQYFIGRSCYLKVCRNVEFFPPLKNTITLRMSLFK